MAKVLQQPAHATTMILARSADSKELQTQYKIDRHVLFDFAPQDIVQSNHIHRAIDQDREAVPLPIAELHSDSDGIFGRLAALDNEHVVFTPLPGHEHLFRSSMEVFNSAGKKRGEAQKSENKELPASTTDSAPKRHLSDQKTAVATFCDIDAEPAVEHIPVEDTERHKTQGPGRAKKPVKTRTNGSRGSRITLLSHNVAASHIQGDPFATITDEITYTFFIGDVDALVNFWKTRLWECTLKPLRKIIEKWVSIRWPQRRRLPYDRPDKPASERIAGWPKNVRYKEPAHLKQPDCIELICSLLLDVRTKDDETGKCRINWIRTLKKVSEHELEYGPEAQFSNAKASSEYGRNYKALFKTQLWPSVMHTAQSFEDHVAQYDLYEGNESSDPEAKKGKQITWSPIKRMPKAVRTRREPAKKRARRADSPAVEGIKGYDSDETDDDGCLLVHFEEGEVSSGALTTQNSSFTSNLPDRSPSPTSTVADEDIEAQMEICPDSKAPAVVDQPLHPRPSFWSGESDHLMPPCSTFTSPNTFFPLNLQYISDVAASDAFSTPSFPRAQVSSAFGLQPFVPTDSTSSLNPSFPLAGAHHPGSLGAPVARYISEAEDMYSSLGFPSQCIDSGNGYIMTQYNMQPMNYAVPPQQYNPPNPQRPPARNTSRMLQDRHFVGIPVEPTVQPMAEDTDAKPLPAMI